MSEKVERLVNLTVALLESRRPLSFAELKRGLHAYGQDDAESARRMFERDKDALRSLGVPIETRSLPLSDEQGYFVDRAAYTLPPVELSSEQVAALAVALQATGEQSSRLGLSKLTARAPDPTGVPIPSARIGLDLAEFDAIAEAVANGQALRFPYRRSDGTSSVRTVDPYGVVSRHGRWYVVGRDHDRDDVRSFRLDRVEGKLAPTGPARSFEVPAGFDAAARAAGPEVEPVDADIAFHPDAAWDAEARGGVTTGETADGWTTFRFAAVQPWRVLNWVLGLGASAEVLGPPELRAAAVAHLEQLVDAP